MQLGAFSISLAVEDLATSRSFYEKLGFTVTGGDGEKYLMMASGIAVIGLFQGLFDRNVLTFNPGLAQDMSQVADFTDVRTIRASLVADGIEMHSDTDPEGTAPAGVVFVDPDGNPILVDQFFPKPGTGGAQAPQCEDPATEEEQQQPVVNGRMPRGASAAGCQADPPRRWNPAWKWVSAHCRSLCRPIRCRASGRPG